MVSRVDRLHGENRAFSGSIISNNSNVLRSSNIYVIFVVFLISAK